jgi:hypothetical protein
MSSCISLSINIRNTDYFTVAGSGKRLRNNLLKDWYPNGRTNVLEWLTGKIRPTVHLDQRTKTVASYVGFEVFTAVVMKSIFFGCIILCVGNLADERF